MASIGQAPTETLEDWVSKWQNNKCKWHKDHINPVLLTCAHLLMKKPQMKIFIPLCGKTVDLKWFYDQGHTVVGVEYAEKPILEFFNESNLQFTKEHLPQVPATLYTSSDNRLRIYSCDFFKFTRDIENNFDVIWDRGSFVAIKREQQTNYSDILISLLALDGRCLMESYEYENKDFKGSPRPVSDEIVHDAFGAQCNILKVYEDYESNPVIAKFCLPLKQAAIETKVHAHMMTLKWSEEDNFWKMIWECGPGIWHRYNVNENLVKFSNLLTGGRTNSTIFVPLCGSTVDMKWLLDQGHCVHGIDLSPLAIEGFLSENKFSYVMDECPAINGSVYKTMDGRCRLYCGDFFRFNSSVAQQYDCIWDRASLQALEPSLKLKYIAVMKNLLSPSGRYLLESQQYGSEFEGPPYSITRDDVNNFFGDWCSVKFLYGADEKDSFVRDHCSHLLDRAGTIFLSYTQIERLMDTESA